MIETKLAAMLSSKKIMESAALKLFRKSDLENKGFIVKRDMQRMKEDISLTPEQLEIVFDTLDVEKNGFLTGEQFLKGFREYLMVSADSARGSSITDYEDEPTKDDYNEALINTLNLIKGTNILKTSVEELEYISEQMKDKSGSQLVQWELFLKSLYKDLQSYKESQAKIEKLIKQKDNQHQAYVRKMFEEMEIQIREAKEKEKHNEHLHRRIQEELKIIRCELLMKDELLQQLSTECRELKKQLQKAKIEEEKTKSLNCSLMSKQSSYETELEEERLRRIHVENMFDSMRQRISIEKSQCFKEGFHLARRVINMEEEGLMQQLQMLEDMQRVLQNNKSDKT